MSSCLRDKRWIQGRNFRGNVCVYHVLYSAPYVPTSASHYALRQSKGVCGRTDESWSINSLPGLDSLWSRPLISTCRDFDPWLSAAVSGASQRRGDMWDTCAPPQGGTVSDSMPALRFLAFKERPQGPPPTMLLNKQGWVSADHNHWAKMKSSLGEGTRLRYSLSVCFMYLDQFTDLNWAILIVTSSLQARSLGGSAKSVMHEAWSWLSQSFPVPNVTRSH